MCGITLLFDSDSWSGLTTRNDITQRMSNELLHRGMDQISVMNYQTVSVGFNRMAVTEIDSQQPSDQNWIVYLNGEIYNYKELGYKGNEVEVIAKGIEREGFKFINKLNGMFVIVAIHNEDVYVIRDRYGIKPFYYWRHRNKFIGASEIKAIIQHPKYEVNANGRAVKSWLTVCNQFDDQTLFEDIYTIPAGQIAHLNTGKMTQYHRCIFTPEPMDYIEATREVRHLVIQAIERQRYRSDQSAAFVSGGLDSSIIRYVLNDITTITAGYNDIDDERSQAKLMTNGKHIEVAFDQPEAVSETIYHLEDLRVGASWPNYVLYHRLAQMGKRICYDGAGADELFGGYSWRYDLSKHYSDILNRTGTKDYQHPNLSSIVDRYQFDLDHFLPGILYVADKLSMAHTIEVRVPYLDNDLVDFCLKLPIEFKQDKKILRDAFSDVLPASIVSGQKRGFTSPDWLGAGGNNQADRWARFALSEWLRIFKPENTEQICQTFTIPMTDSIRQT